MTDIRTPAGFYRELLALRELRDSVRIYRDKYMLDELEGEYCSEWQHEDAVRVDQALEHSEAIEWHSKHEIEKYTGEV